MPLITRRSSTRGLPGLPRGRWGSIAAQASSDNHNKCVIAAFPWSINVVGRKSSDPGIKFDWRVVEAAGLGIRRNTADPVDFATAYNGFFAAHPAGRIQQGADQTGITELRHDLTLIGYTLSNAAGYDDSVRRCIMVFCEHFMQQDGQEFVSRDIAEVIKQVVAFLQP
jgi:N-acetyl-anhydromuramyl-L-alanine amidase AmpD